MTTPTFTLDNGLVRVVIDARAVTSRSSTSHRAGGDRAGRSRATCCSCTATCRTSGTRGTSTSTTDVSSASSTPSTRSGWRASRTRPRSSCCARSANPGSSRCSPWRRAHRRRDRQRRRLAREAEVPQARFPARRPRRTVGGRDAVRARLPTDPRQHVVGVARFEVCAHRFVHVEEPGFGVAVANDSTYGHDVTRRTRADGGTTTTVRQSLLRAPLFPDPGADQGRHVLRTTVRAGHVGRRRDPRGLSDEPAATRRAG